MSTIPVLSACKYLTEVEGLTWRGPDYAALKIVKAVKGEPIKGYFEISIRGKKHLVDQRNAEQFVTALAKGMGSKLRKTLGDGKEISIIAIPNSSAVVSSSAAYRTDDLAKQVAVGFGANAIVESLIRWKAARTPQHRGSG